MRSKTKSLRLCGPLFVVCLSCCLLCASCKELSWKDFLSHNNPEGAFSRGHQEDSATGSFPGSLLTRSTTKGLSTPRQITSSQIRPVNQTLRRASKAYSAVILSYADKHVLASLFPLFLTSMKLRPELRHVQDSLMVVVPTEEDLDLCMSLHSICHLDDHTEVPYVEIPKENEVAEWLTLRTVRASWRRVDYVEYILSMDITVILMDLDMLVLKNPFSLLQHQDYKGLDVFAQADFKTAKETVNVSLINMGFSFFRATPAAKALVSKWTQGRLKWDQGYLQTLLKEKAVPGLRWKAIAHNLSYNLCHLRMGSARGAVPSKNRLPPQTFFPAFYNYVVRNRDAMNTLYTFHVNCCNTYPTSFTCKSLVLHLALDAFLSREKA